MPSPTLNDLILAYRNEKAAKRLLPYASRPVEYFLDAISRRIEEVKSLGKTIARNIYELELERVKFFIKEYIQVRLKKLSTNLYLDKSLLSEREVSFYDKYIDLLKGRDIYIAEQKFPKRNEFVGFYCCSDINGVMIDGELLEMFKGDFFVAPLDDVMDLLRRNEIILF
ncbi:GINS Sld5 subunit domain-containing protein [Encephalitozoon hellem]|nr:GINS Sld5 subunit domain-containing protein [Encephalitozoon hellem]